MNTPLQCVSLVPSVNNWGCYWSCRLAQNPEDAHNAVSSLRYYENWTGAYICQQSSHWAKTLKVNTTHKSIPFVKKPKRMHNSSVFPVPLEVTTTPRSVFFVTKPNKTNVSSTLQANQNSLGECNAATKLLCHETSTGDSNCASHQAESPEDEQRMTHRLCH